MLVLKFRCCVIMMFIKGAAGHCYWSSDTQLVCWMVHSWFIWQSTPNTKCDARIIPLLQAPPVIHTPHALPMFKEGKQIRKRKSEKDRDDAVKFHKPEAGSSAATLGRGAAGLIGKTGGTLLTQYILKNHVSLLHLASAPRILSSAYLPWLGLACGSPEPLI